MRFGDFIRCAVFVFAPLMTVQAAWADVTLKDLADRQRAAELKKFEDSLKARDTGSASANTANNIDAAPRKQLQAEKPREAQLPIFKVMSIFGPSDNLTAEFSTPDGKAGYLRRGDIFLGQRVTDVRADGVVLQSQGANPTRLVKPGDSLK